MAESLELQPPARALSAEPSPSRSSAGKLDRALPWLALAGTLVALVHALVRSVPLQPGQGHALYPLLILPPLVLLAVALFMPRALQRLRRQPALLVPLGVLSGITGIAGGLLFLPGLQRWDAGILDGVSGPLPFSLFLHALMPAALHLAYATWMTVLVVRSIPEGRVPLADGLREVPGRFLRMLGLALAGWGTLILGALIIMAFASLTSFGGFLLVCWLVLWNLATAALLPVGLMHEGDMAGALQAGIRASVLNVRRWWPAVVSQLVLLGVVTHVVVSSSTAPAQRSVSHTGTHLVWTGGFESQSQWLPVLMKAVDTPAMPLAELVLALVFGGMAIAVKIHIVEMLTERMAARGD